MVQLFGRQIVGRAQDQWQANDALAKVIIRNSLDNDHEAKVRGKQSSKEMFDHLVRLKERRTQPNMALALQEFYDLKWKGDVETHLGAVTEAVAKLTSAGRRPDDQAIINKVLTTLPAEFAHFRSSWNMNKIDDDDVTYDDFQAALEAEADIITASSYKAEDSAGGSALSAGKKGKQEEDQEEKRKERQEEESIQGRVLRVPRARTHEGAVSSAEGTRFSRQKEGHHHCCKSYGQDYWTVMSEWIGDSGASWHMTSHKEWVRGSHACT